MKQPNIIYLHTHDCGRFIQPYGHQFQTPNLMRLAQEGVTFRQAHCVAPSCSPSRAGLLTGEYTHTNGMFGLASRCSGWTLNDYSHHLCHTLKANGYETALSGVQHLAKMPISDRDWLGYDLHLNPLPKEAHDDFHYNNIETAAADYIKQAHDKPFFLSAGFLDPHRADGDIFIKHGDLDAEADSRYEKPLPLYFDNETARIETAKFRRGVTRIDNQFGVVLDAVREAGIEDNTVIICTTDHGVGFPKMKSTLTDGGTGVFLIVKGPMCEKGTVKDGLVSHVDIFPTICDMLGIDAPGWLQGTSFLPMLTGAEDSVRHYLFTEQNFHGSYRPLRAVTDGRFKLIRCFLDNPNETAFCTDPGPIHQFLCDVDYGMTTRTVAQYQLYDRYFDPLEVHNVADDPTYQVEFDRLVLQLNLWMEQTQDPILTDSIPKQEPDNEFKHYTVDMGYGYPILI